MAYNPYAARAACVQVPQTSPQFRRPIISFSTLSVMTPAPIQHRKTRRLRQELVPVGRSCLLGVRVPPVLLGRLRAEARDEGLTMSDVVRRLLVRHLEPALSRRLLEEA